MCTLNNITLFLNYSVAHKTRIKIKNNKIGLGDKIFYYPTNILIFYLEIIAYYHQYDERYIKNMNTSLCIFLAPPCSIIQGFNEANVASNAQFGNTALD